jgi:hypothetical protein
MLKFTFWLHHSSTVYSSNRERLQDRHISTKIQYQKFSGQLVINSQHGKSQNIILLTMSHAAIENMEACTILCWLKRIAYLRLKTENTRTALRNLVCRGYHKMQMCSWHEYKFINYKHCWLPVL